MAIKGKSKALKKLNDEILKLKKRTLKGMASAALMVKVKSQMQTPVDQGNLKASHYTSVQNTFSGPVAEVGCTAKYAIFVHEDLNATHTVGKAKFLEHALHSSTKDILNIIKNVTKLP